MTMVMHIMLPLALVGGAGALLGQAVGRFSIADDARPLATMAENLEHKIGEPVNYEDALYEYSGDLIDITKEVAAPDFVASHPNYHVISMRRGSLVGEYDEAELKKSPETVLNRMITAYNLSNPPATFRLLTKSDGFIIVPDTVKKASGVLVGASRPLDTPITIEPGTRSARETLQILLRTLSAKNAVGLGSEPTNLIDQSTVTLQADNEPARDVLMRFCSGLVWADSAMAALGRHRRLAWGLYYDPGLKMYMLNLRVVMLERNVPYRQEPELFPADY